MKAQLTHTRTSPFLKSGPPPVPKKPVPKKENPTFDSVDLERAAPRELEEQGLKKPLLAALATVSAVTALTAGSGMLQAPEIQQELIVEAEDLDLLTEPDTINLTAAKNDTTETKVGVQFSSTNDFMPDSWTNWLGRPEHKIPDGTAFDDDGWTAEVRLSANIQQENEELFVGGRLMMLTETGSRFPFGENYTGKRTDVAELVAQKNFRLQLDPQTTLDYGFGGGLQAVGNVGGESLQRWYHAEGPVGGRVGDDLQGHQVNESFRVMPLVTSGAKLTHQWHPNFDVVAGAQANVPVGRGLGVVGLKAGVGAEWRDFRVEGGAKLDATWGTAPEFYFADPSGVRPGAYGRLEYEPGKFGAFYTQLETGGFRNEPVLTFGIRFGGGTQPRLDPFQ